MDLQVTPVTGENFIGREEDLQFITKKLREFRTEETNLLIITGVAGIGKTTLANQILKQIQTPRTFQLYGKFRDQEEKIPYLAIKQALKMWTNQMLTLPEVEYENLKSAILQALQFNACQITKVFEDLIPFFGKKYSQDTSGSSPEVHQIQARFYYFFLKFLKAIHTSGYQLTLFIDDLQWVDDASLSLLIHLLKSDQFGLLIIVANRSVDGLEINELLVAAGERSFSYHLQPLPTNSLKDFLPEDWKITSESKNTLIKYLELQSGGNPFKLKQLIRLVKNEGFTSKADFFDAHALNKLPQLPLEKDTENLIKAQLQKLTREQKEILGIASQIGFNFSLELLQKIINRTLPEIFRQLEQFDLLIINGNNGIFRHDIIYKVATNLIAPERKSALHCQLFHAILDTLPDYFLPEYFTAVNHLNQSLDSSTTDDSQVSLYNLHAGNLAVRNAAFKRAGKYYCQARLFYQRIRKENVIVQDEKLASALSEQIFKDDHLGFTISFADAQTSFLQKNYQQCIKEVNELLNLTLSREQKVKTVNLKLMSCSAIMHLPNTRAILEDGIQSLTSVLADFDIQFPSSEKELFLNIADFCWQIEQLETTWPDKQVPLDSDPEMYELQKMIINSLTFLYYMDVKKNLYLSLNTLLIILKTGLTPISPVFFSLGFLLGVVDAKYINTGFRLGKRAIKLIEEQPYNLCYHIVYYIATLNYFAWENHYDICMDRLQIAVKKAYELGDHQYVSFCFNIIVLLHNYSGKNLLKQKELSDRLQKENSHTFFISTSNYLFIQFLIAEKAGFNSGKFIFPSELINESKYNLSSLYHLNLNLSVLYLLSGNYKKAANAGAVCEGMPNVYRGFQIELEHFFYYSIIVLELCFQKKMPWQKAIEIVSPKLQEFKRLASYRSGNYLHKEYLIVAGIEKNQDNFESATHYYDLAIAEAEKQQFVHIAAIASEIAANYYLQKGRSKISELYLRQAIDYYERWGAKVKVDQLKQQHSHLFHNQKISSRLVDEKNALFKDVLEINQNYLQINLPTLGFQLLQKLVKYSKANHGFIFISVDKNWQVLAVSMKKLQHLLNQPIRYCNEFLPEKVINYAIHQGTYLSSDDVKNNPLFEGDTYLQNIKTSGQLLFYPILNENEKLALIYLEGAGIQNAELFRWMAEQVAVVLINAINYEKLKLLNKELKGQEQMRIATAIASQEKERKRIAEELHDSLGQMLALIRLNFSQLDKEFVDEKLATLFSNTTRMLDDSCQEVRTISYNLMPPDINLPLQEMLDKLIRKSIDQSLVKYQFNTYAIKGEFSEAFKFTIYRVLQEIMHNIIKHSGASHLNITLTRIDNEINLMVEDNGKGFDKKIAVMGLGLKNINSRVKLLNGFFDVDSSLNRGTIYNITLPIDQHGKD